MNIIEFLKPTKSKLRFAALLFAGVNTAHAAWVWFIAATSITFEESSVGFPISFYCVVNCEQFGQSIFSIGDTFNVLRFSLNVLFWYGIAVIVKRNKP